MNITEAKALFFAQYLGQKVITDTIDANYISTLYGVNGNEYLTADFFTGPLSFELVRYDNKITGHLLLRTIEQLTDGENKKIAGWSAYRLTDKNTKQIATAMIRHLFEFNKWSGDTIIEMFNYLRLIGILLPFTYLNEENKPVTLSPDEIIKLGWVKIKE